MVVLGIKHPHLPYASIYWRWLGQKRVHEFKTERGKTAGEHWDVLAVDLGPPMPRGKAAQLFPRLADEVGLYSKGALW